MKITDIDQWVGHLDIDQVSPLFSALYGWGLLHETITWHFFASGAIVLVGLYLFHKDELTVQQKALQSR